MPYDNLSIIKLAIYKFILVLESWQAEIVEIYKGFHYENRDIKPWDQYRGDTRPSDTTVLNKISLREDLEYPLNNR